jgi:hypothetical protein
MGNSRRFREAIASAGLQYDGDRGLDIHFMSGRNKYGFDLISCPENGAHDPVPV